MSLGLKKTTRIILHGRLCTKETDMIVDFETGIETDFSVIEVLMALELQPYN